MERLIEEATKYAKERKERIKAIEETMRVVEKEKKRQAKECASRILKVFDASNKENTELLVWKVWAKISEGRIQCFVSFSKNNSGQNYNSLEEMKNNSKFSNMTILLKAMQAVNDLVPTDTIIDDVFELIKSLDDYEIEKDSNWMEIIMK